MNIKEDAWALADYLDNNVEAMWATEQKHIDQAANTIRSLIGELNKYKMAWNMAENELAKAEERNLKIVRKNEHLLGEFFKVKEQLECALDYIKQYQIEVKD